MAGNQPGIRLDLLAWRRQQFAVCHGASGGFGDSVSAANAAFAFLRTGLEDDMVNRSCAPAVAGRSIKRGDSSVGQRMLDGSHHSVRDSLALCYRKLCEEAWRSMEIDKSVAAKNRYYRTSRKK